MLIVSSDYAPGRQVEKILGLVSGSTVQSRPVQDNLLGSLRTVFGGEIADLTRLMTDARKIALRKMEQEARSLKADAIVSVRMQTATLPSGGIETLVYGTAVILEGDLT